MTSSSTMDTPQRTAPEFRARYEALRRHAVMRDSPPEPRDGLAVLLREGIPAWLAAWSRVPAPVPTARVECRSPVLPDGVSADVIRVLAAMALGHLQEVRRP